MYRLQKCVALLVIWALACGLAGCAWSPVRPYRGQAPRLQTLYVIASGWHTEIGVAADALSGPLARMQREFPHARYLVFGWGEREYYMAPNPGLGDLLRALLPAPSVMLVIPTEHSPASFFAGKANLFALPVAQQGLDRLSRFLWDYLDTGVQQQTRRIGNGPYRESAFYASKGTYSLANTCNTWTAEALRVAGLPVSPAGVVSAGQLVDQLRGLAEPE